MRFDNVISVTVLPQRSRAARKPSLVRIFDPSDTCPFPRLRSNNGPPALPSRVEKLTRKGRHGALSRGIRPRSERLRPLSQAIGRATRRTGGEAEHQTLASNAQRCWLDSRSAALTKLPA